MSVYMDPHAQPFTIAGIDSGRPPLEPTTPALEGAACRGVGPSVFFPAHGDTVNLQRAKAICAGCPVRVECLDMAMTYGEREGVWGGLSANERRQLRAQRAQEPTTNHYEEDAS